MTMTQHAELEKSLCEWFILFAQKSKETSKMAGKARFYPIILNYKHWMAVCSSPANAAIVCSRCPFIFKAVASPQWTQSPVLFLSHDPSFSFISRIGKFIKVLSLSSDNSILQKNHLFIAGCAESSLLSELFSSYSHQGLLSSCGAWAFHCGGFSCCRV